MRKTIYTKLDTLFSARYVRENELNYIVIRDMLKYRRNIRKAWKN